MKQRTRLSADRRITPPVLYAVQGDTGREIVARFRDYQILAGATATISGRLPSGEAVSVEAAITDQTVTADLTALLAETGNVRAQLEISDGKMVTSFAFGIIVHEDFLSGYGYEEVGPADQVTFTTDMAAPVKCVLVTLTPQQSGSGTPSPDNVRPITGTESVTVTRVGKNILPAPSTWTTGKRLNPTTGAEVADNDCAVTDYIPVSITANSPYYLSGLDYADIDRYYRTFTAAYNANKEFLGRTGGVYSAEYPLTAESFSSGTPQGTGDIAFIRVTIYHVTGYTANFADIMAAIEDSAQIEMGSTATAYESYAGATFTIDLGRTVYGGTVDLVTGVLTVTHGITNDLNYATWVALQDVQNVFTCSPDYFPGADFNSTPICNAYNGGTPARNNATAWAKGNATISFRYPTSDRVYVRDDRFTTAAEIKAAMEGVEVVYKLATPETYQLTPAQIMALLGENTVTSDAGQVTVKYLRREAAG